MKLENDIIYGKPRVSYNHGHYCEQKLFCYGKRDFNCPYKVKYKNAGHKDKCDFCESMLAVYFQDNIQEYRVLAFFRMNEKGGD